jgi:heterodisulfide reductase subunit B
MKTVGYYPGCSLEGSGCELDLSVRAVSEAAGAALCEIEDWNCCGATSAHALNHDLAVALPYRVLALAEAQGLREVLAPCAACFSRLKGTAVRLGRSEELAARMRGIVGLDYRGTVGVLNVVEYTNRLLEDGLAGKLGRPRGGMKVAAYYGCLLSRGEGIVENEDHENPSGMAAAIRAAGGEPVEWNFATECCGGGLSLPLTDAVVDLAEAILADARAAGAEAVVVGCPMCHSNLDMRQRMIRARGRAAGDMPVVYLTELVGLAAGLDPKALGLDRHFVDAMHLAARLPTRLAATRADMERTP